MLSRGWGPSGRHVHSFATCTATASAPRHFYTNPCCCRPPPPLHAFRCFLTRLPRAAGCCWRGSTACSWPTSPRCSRCLSAWSGHHSHSHTHGQHRRQTRQSCRCALGVGALSCTAHTPPALHHTTCPHTHLANTAGRRGGGAGGGAECAGVQPAHTCWCCLVGFCSNGYDCVQTWLVRKWCSWGRAVV
jgi:hypothetical protein